MKATITMFLLIATIMAITLSAGCVDQNEQNHEDKNISTPEPPVTDVQVNTTGGYTLGSSSEDPVSTAKLAVDQWRVLTNNGKSYRATIAMDGLEENESRNLPDLKLVFPKGQTVELKNAVLSRTGDAYFLSSDVPEGNYGLSAGTLHGDYIANNIGIGEWKGTKIEFFEQGTGPAPGEKVVITISGFI